MKKIFEAALAVPLDERPAFLSRVCEGDQSLRSHLESLLEAEQNAPSFLEQPLHGDPTVPLGPGYKAGDHIGRYKLLERIGEGGFGLVYVAEQRQPVKRRVALKIIKLGMDTEQVIARFEAERQALAMMDHPNIAKVHDAGATDTGRPYFVMELVRGIPITEYCDTEKLDTQSRLNLFASVCHAIQHAHQKGVIHRDIKPNNVMVTLHDGVPVPKVIDFGIAKATNAELTEKTIYTQHRQMIGTPAYMSPEQAEMSGLDVDTRSDIYSLGVLLYELLTGTTPLNPERLRSAAYGELQRIIREEDPDKPSTRVSGLRSEPSTPPHSHASAQPTSNVSSRQDDHRAQSLISDIAKQRRIDPNSLTRSLRGDLDWIVMKCLEKDRTRRYETANAIASDIQRHLQDQPVEAGPPTATYRFRKFARRNKVALFTTTTVAASFVLGLTLALYGLFAADRQRAIADQEKAVAQAVNYFLTDDLLAAVAPSSRAGRGKDVLMRDVLDQAALRVDRASSPGGRFEKMPVVEASIRATLGSTYLQLGEYSSAELHLEKAHLLRQRELGVEHPHTLTSMHDLAYLYREQGRRDEAERLYTKTLEIRKRVLGDENRGTLDSMNNLASLYNSMGRHDEAEPLHVETLEIRSRVLGAEHRSTLASMNNLASLYTKQSRYDEAERLFVETLGIMRRVLGADAPYTLNCANNLASLYAGQGHYDQAEPLFTETLEIRKRILGEEHPATLISMANLAGLYTDQGRYDKAEPLYVETLEIKKRVLGEAHPSTLATMKQLSNLYANQEKSTEALPLLRALQEAKRLQIERPETSPGDKNDFAWELLTREPAELRDPQSALRLARDSCALTNNTNPIFLDTLALAQHLTGDTPAAIESQTKALSLLPLDAPDRSTYQDSLDKFKATLQAQAESEEVSTNK